MPALRDVLYAQGEALSCEGLLPLLADGVESRGDKGEAVRSHHVKNKIKNKLKSRGRGKRSSGRNQTGEKRILTPGGAGWMMGMGSPVSAGDKVTPGLKIGGKQQ